MLTGDICMANIDDYTTLDLNNKHNTDPKSSGDHALINFMLQD